MKKLRFLFSALILSTLFFVTGCDDSDEEAPKVTVFNANIDGQPFSSKVTLGRFFYADQMLDIEGHEVDSTYDDQFVIGIQIEYNEINGPTEYNFAEHEVVDDLICYFFDKEQKSYYPREGTLTIKKINTKEFEATFSSLLLKSSYPNASDIVLTDGNIRVDLVETLD
jgi:hypothetical protein